MNPKPTFPNGAESTGTAATGGTTANSSKPREWSIRIPNWSPPSENVVLGWHWRKKEALKKEVAEFMAIYAALANVPKVTDDYRPVRYVHMLAIYPRQSGRLPDPENLYKITHDAMKRAWLIVDDSQEWLKTDRPTLQRGESRETIITIRDV